MPTLTGNRGHDDLGRFRSTRGDPSPSPVGANHCANPTLTEEDRAVLAPGNASSRTRARAAETHFGRTRFGGEGSGGQASESTAGQAGEGTAGGGGEGGDKPIEPPCPNPMVFEDEAVESSVRLQLGDAPIGPEEAATLTELSVDLPRTTIDLRVLSVPRYPAPRRRIRRADRRHGIASLSKLKELTLHYAVLENAELLAHPTKLERLSMASITPKDLPFVWKLISCANSRFGTLWTFPKS